MKEWNVKLNRAEYMNISERIFDAETKFNELDSLTDEDFYPMADQVDDLLKSCIELIRAAKKQERIRNSGLKLVCGEESS